MERERERVREKQREGETVNKISDGVNFIRLSRLNTTIDTRLLLSGLYNIPYSVLDDVRFIWPDNPDLHASYMIRQL